MPLLTLFIDTIMGGAELIAIWTAAMAFLAVVALLGAVGFTMKALSDMVKALCGVKDKVMRRHLIDKDGREVIEEIPYSPAMNMLNVAVQTRKEITDGRG